MDLDHSVAPVPPDRDDNGRRLHLLRGAVAAFAVLALVVTLAYAFGDGRNNGPQVTTDERAKVADAAASAIIGALPRSAIDGKASWKLPVVAKPQTGLQDGDTIAIYGRGFGANESLGIVQCSSEADTGAAGIGACQLRGDNGATYGGVTYASASNEGTVVARVVVHRFITTPDGGKVDCQSAAERCLIGMGAISNYDQSGGTYINFGGAPAFPEPELKIDPAGPHAPGQSVTAQIRGWVPLRAIRVQQCRGGTCQKLVDAKADALGAANLAVVVQPSIVDEVTGTEIPCDGKCVLQANGIGVKGGSSAPLPAPVSLTFTSETPSGPLTTLAPTTTTTVAVSPPDTAPRATVPAVPTVPATTETTEPVTTTSSAPSTTAVP